MFKKSTIKTKTFIVSFLSIAGGVYFIINGKLETGIELICIGITGSVLRDAVSKVY
jgi:hypothetical protein